MLDDATIGTLFYVALFIVLLLLLMRVRRGRGVTPFQESVVRRAVINKPIEPSPIEDAPRIIVFDHENHGILNYLEGVMRDHELVESAYVDTGHWYTNGEEGPEWTNLKIRAKSEYEDAVIAAAMKVAEAEFGDEGKSLTGKMI